MSKKAVVIGGGLSGLSCASLLSKQGYQVTLIEKNKDLGGRARVLKTNGFVFDMGPSWYLMPEVIENLFQALGHKTSDFFTLKPLDNKYRIFSQRLSPITLTNNREKNLDLFKKIDPQSINNIEKLIKKTSFLYDLAVNNFLNRPYHNLFNFLNFKDLINGLRLLSIINPFQSYHKFIEKYVKNKSLQKIFEFHTVFLGGSPFQTPALYSMLVAADFEKQVWYPLGGMGQLVKALEKIAKKNDVKILTNTEVNSLIIDEKKHQITGVKINQKSLNADLVINASDYANFDLKIVPEKYRDYSKEYWDKRDYSISSILIYLGINKKIPELSHHNFYFQDNWEEHFKTIKTGALPKKPCFYISAPSNTDPSVAPKNQENLFVLIPIGVKTKENQLSKYVDHVLKHIENVIGIKFINDICYKKIYGKSDFAKDYNAYMGNALGLSHTLLQSVFLRPRMKSKKLKNLYHVGQFTQPGVGVPMVLLSALYINDIIKNEKE